MVKVDAAIVTAATGSEKGWLPGGEGEGFDSRGVPEGVCLGIRWDYQGGPLSWEVSVASEWRLRRVKRRTDGCR